MDRLRSTKIVSGTSLILAAVLLLAVNILSSLLFKGAQLDLTENQLYTLSDGTENILSGLEENISLKLYFSKKLAVDIPQVSRYANRVRDLLENYADISKGKIDLQILDPEPFSEEEDQAVQYQLQGVPVDTAGSLLYFGLVGTNETDKQEIIAFFQEDKEQSLEYDLTRLIHQLAHPKKKLVGLMSSLPIDAPVNPMNPVNQSWMISDVIRKSFNMTPVAAEIDQIPENIDILMIVHPKGLSDKTLYAIDQFVLAGGRVLAFVDAYAEADMPATDPQNPLAAMTAPRNSDLKKLMDQWGVQLVNGKFAGDIESATRVTVNNAGRPQSIQYIAWLTLTPEYMSQDDFVTQGLKQINLASAGILKTNAAPGITITPLLQTSAKAMAVDLQSIQFGPNPANLLNNYQAGSEKLMLAARINGKANSAFPDGLAGSPGPNHLAASKQDINVIIVADSDFLSDKFWVNVQNFFGRRIAMPRSGNGNFVVNSLENLGGSNDLISLRSRGKSSRPFTRVQELKAEAEKRFLDKEKALRSRLQETEQKINQLQNQKEGANSLILSPEQQQEIQSFREQQVKTRKELRSVQHELRSSIESLGSTLKFINIGLIPALIILLAVSITFYRYRKQRANT